MPKRYLLAIAIMSLTLAACGGATEADLFGVAATPTPSPTPYVANPADTVATIEALASAAPSASPVPGVTIYEATPAPNGGLPSPLVPIASAVTNNIGQASFTGLVYNKPYCWWWIVSPQITYSACVTSQEWSGGIIPLGTGF
jgi:hypothetical protein